MRRHRSHLFRRGLNARVISAACCLVLVATSIQIPYVAATTAAPTGEGSNLPSAASLPHPELPTEVAARRTAYGTTYDNHDGTYTTHVSTGPVNYLPPGSKVFEPIDTTLTEMPGQNGRVRASKMPTPVEIGAADDANGFISMDTGKGVIKMFLAPGDRPGKAGEKPKTNGSKASVAGLIGSIDLEAVADATGVRTFFVLKSRPSSSSFSLAFDTGGLTPTLQTDGSIEFLDKKGSLAASMPRPYAVDSDVDPNIGSGKTTYDVSYSLTESGKRWILTVSVDPSWLEDATYPVYVDPSVIGTAQVWNNTVNNQSALINAVMKDMYSRTGYHEFLVGYDSLSQWAAYMKFDLAAAGITGYILSASLDMYPWHQWYTTGERTWVEKVTTSWDTNTITWNNAPFHSAPYPSADANFVGNKNQWTSAATWTNGDLLTTWARDWQASSTTNYGIYLYGNQGQYSFWKRFTSSQSGSNQPHLDITYAIPSVTAPSPTGNVWTNSRTLEWEYANPNGPAWFALGIVETPVL